MKSLIDFIHVFYVHLLNRSKPEL